MALNLSNPKPALFYAGVIMSIFPTLHGPSAGMIYAVALSVEVTFYAIVTFLMATAPVRRALLEQAVTDEGQRVVGWRDIPVDKDYVGITANFYAPYIKHLVVAAEGPLASDPDAFERKLYVIRKVSGHAIRALSAQEAAQIAGRAGRAGYDTAGTVVVQAPEHEVENLRQFAKVADDPKKRRKLVRKKAHEGMVPWSKATMERRMERVRVNRSNIVCPSPARIASRIKARSVRKRSSISSTASRLCRNTSRHITGSLAAMRVKSRKPGPPSDR